VRGEGASDRGTCCVLAVVACASNHSNVIAAVQVKPSNLLLTSDGRAKLGDLGMTCHMDKAGLAAGRAGTPNFMASETRRVLLHSSAPTPQNPEPRRLLLTYL
jgi:serine/threonine protein kinase